MAVCLGPLKNHYTGGIKMIKWEDSMDVSLKKAKDERKLVLVDFFNPQ